MIQISLVEMEKDGSITLWIQIFLKSESILLKTERDQNVNKINGLRFTGYRLSTVMAESLKIRKVDQLMVNMCGRTQLLLEEDKAFIALIWLFRS